MLPHVHLAHHGGTKYLELAIGHLVPREVGAFRKLERRHAHDDDWVERIDLLHIKHRLETFEGQHAGSVLGDTPQHDPARGIRGLYEHERTGGPLEVEHCRPGVPDYGEVFFKVEISKHRYATVLLVRHLVHCIYVAAQQRLHELAVIKVYPDHQVMYATKVLQPVRIESNPTAHLVIDHVWLSGSSGEFPGKLIGSEIQGGDMEMVERLDQRSRILHVADNPVHDVYLDTLPIQFHRRHGNTV